MAQVPLNPKIIQTRRHFYRDCGVGLGKIALASLLAEPFANRVRAADGIGAGIAHGAGPLAPRAPHFAPKAKRVIYLFMAGAPSQLDLFDPKPALTKYDGQPVPPEVVKGQRYAFIQPNASLMAPRYKFARYGQTGADLSEMLPHLAKAVDEIAIVRSVHTDQFNHAPAQIFMNTGSSLPGRPSMGAWVTYGLGNEATDLPGFVVLSSAGGTSGGAANWSCGFLPASYQGVPFRSKGDPILNVTSPHGFDRTLQRDTIDLVRGLNQRHATDSGDPEIDARIASYELAYRMQTSAPDLINLADESQETLDLYGAKPGEASFANNCLLARRLIERGVRFVNLYHEGWDHHSDVAGGLKTQCGLTDQASAGACPRPQAPGLARRYPGRLGRRVRPDPDGRVQRRARPEPGTRPSPPSLHDVVRRWWRQAGIYARGDR